MKNIMVIGAGRSATDLIHYLLERAEANDWYVTVGDFDEELARQKVGDHPRGKAIFFDATDTHTLGECLDWADAAVSFLPPPMHPPIARACLERGVHLVTASYVSDEMRALDEDAKAKGLIFLNEIGADPGIDHMGAMRNIHDIRAHGGVLHSLYSYGGALVAPECNDNPWGYKFTWLPMNVVLAGQGAPVRFIQDGRLHFVPYHRLFASAHKIHFPGPYGELEAYPNRDSLPYRDRYGLHNLPTMLRSTLRVPGFCQGWQALVELGLTDHSFRIPNSHKLTYAEWVRAFLPERHVTDLEAGVAACLGLPVDSPVIDNLRWLGLFSGQRIGRHNGTPAEILLDLLSERWVFREGDRDLVILMDVFTYEKEGKMYRRTSSLFTEGVDHQHTAISRTVGLTAAIGMRLILQDQIQSRGVLIPTIPEIYEPVLEELKAFGIAFEEKEETLEVLA